MRKLYPIAIAVLLGLAAFAAPALANTGPGGNGPGKPPHHHRCGQYARVHPHESIAQFARAHGTDVSQVVGVTYVCYYGLPPAPVVDEVNSGDWDAPLGLEFGGFRPILFWGPIVVYR